MDWLGLWGSIWTRAGGRGEGQLQASRWTRARRMGWAGLGRGGKVRPGVRGEGDGEGPVRWGVWGGAKKSAVRHQSPLCTVACSYEEQHVQGASVCTATVLISDLKARHVCTG
ncbi:hypothetical protein PoB_004729700 [Plakobranchus ocellatus]|uniref:Uncharacterized protein n=1 Tax=Plakobranchus ocellatus TaxID=259542 RepID=A0AAV4BPA9_9GAST|nr:hypothetical protein PoB_004729700 [Plakobranchus ocellatus]